MNKNTNDPFDDWYQDEHGTGELEIESDVDDVFADESYDDPESL